MSRQARVMRWLMIVGMSGILPTFILRCDKAALNFQRGLAEGLGLALSDLVVDQYVVDVVTDAEE